ncbi:MAG: hypothetical protein E7571_05580 [Ruminococcaceae bacterium]|nr:hypothetical protein [Oscillospiraceae bacterium]
MTYGGLAGDGGYNIREYRSKSPDGPYEDACGNYATDLKNTGLKLDCNYQFECNPTAYLSGGHSSCLLDNDGSLYQAYHTRFTADDGWGHQMRVHKMARTSDGWAVMLPYEYQGEKDVTLTASQIAGAYQIVDTSNITHRKADWTSPWSDIVVPTQYVLLNADGTVTNACDYSDTVTDTVVSKKAVSGSWSLSKDGAHAVIKLGNVTYNGVFAVQKDESADKNEVIVFSAAGSDNSSLWGAQHFNHNFEHTETAATLTANGEIAERCTLCTMLNPDAAATVINRPKTFTLSASKYVYSGKAIKPAVTVKDANGKAISSANYSLTYSNNKNVGKASVKITFKGNYKCTKILNFTILPKNTAITKLSPVKAGFKIGIKKYTTQTSGYQIQYSLDKNFKKSVKTLTLSNKITSKTITKLAKNKKYFVRIRTYRTVGSAKYYSTWSASKNVKTKK